MTAPILNDRDLALQAAKYRSKQTNLLITGTASAFLASRNSITVLPATIVLTATPSGSVFSSSATYSWSYALSSAPNTWVTLGTGKTQTINNSDLWVKNASVQYRCIISENLLDDAYGYYTVTYSSEGAESNFITLSRTNVLVTCDANGLPLSFNNTDIQITVSRGTTNLAYSTNTTTPNSFTVSYVATDLTAVSPTSTSTSWTIPAISAIAVDGAKITFTITVYDSSATPVATTYTRTVVYNKVNNGSIGADGANLTPVANYDFAGATLPANITFPGTAATYENGTATLLTNTVADQNLRLTNLNLVPNNSYIISMRVKWISGAWEGALFYVNSRSGSIAGESGNYYKAIPQPALDVWTTINVDMRALTAGGLDYLTTGNITQLRFDFINAVGASVAVDYISVGKYGVAEATKSITLSMYQWAASPPAYSAAFTYNWNTGVISGYPSGWSGAAGAATTNGYTLYQRNIVLIDTGLAATTSANWETSSINTIGYRNDGTLGVQGDSYRIAYYVSTSATPPAQPGVTTGSTSIPSGWSDTATANLTDGQYMYQSDGLYSANTTNITWGIPYLSNLKVGSLSALSANLGVVNIATDGNLYSGKTTYGSSNAGFFLGNDGGNAKFKIGTAVVNGESNELGFDSSTGVLTLRGGSVFNAAGQALLSATTVPSDINNSDALAAAASDATTKANAAQTNAASDATTKANAAQAAAALDATTKAATKLNRNAADTIGGPIGFVQDGAIIIGAMNPNTGVPDTGIYLGTGGLVGRKMVNGVSKTSFAISSTTGQATFGGELSAASGTFTGSVNTGAYTGYGWPANFGIGAHLSADGLLIGNYNGGHYFQVTSSGDVYAPKFNIVNGNATFSGAVSGATIATNSGRFSVNSAGKMTCVEADIGRREVLATGLYYPNISVVAYADMGEGTSLYTQPGSWEVRGINKAIDTGVTDNYLTGGASASFNQQFGLSIFAEGQGTYSGGDGNFYIIVKGVATVNRTYSPGGTNANNDAKVYVFIQDISVTAINTTYNSFNLPAIRWKVYKL